MVYGTQDLSSPTRAPTRVTAIEIQSLNHWATREVHSLIS